MNDLWTDHFFARFEVRVHPFNFFRLTKKVIKVISRVQKLCLQNLFNFSRITLNVRLPAFQIMCTNAKPVVLYIILLNDNRS